MAEKPICEKLQYLIGVPSQFIDNYQALNKGLMAETRKLCNLRSVIIANFTDINEQFRNQMQLSEIPRTARLVADLTKYNITIENAPSLSRNVIELNALIDERMEKLSHGFPGIPAEWIQDLFQMPKGDEIEGVQTAIRKYRQYKNFYPYQKYINWPFARTLEEKRSKNILGNDETFLELLAEQHTYRPAELLDFIGTTPGVVVVVDCENSDAQRVYSALKPVCRFLHKIILVDDTHTNKMWDELVSDFTTEGVAVEHDELPRLKEQKSLVDLRMVAKTCEEHFKNGVQNFVLATSDSDIWALITSIPDANVVLLAEKSKCGDPLIEALTQNRTRIIFMEDIMDDCTELQDRLMHREIAKLMNGVSRIGARQVVVNAAQKLLLYLDKDDIDIYISEIVGEICSVEDAGKVIVTPY